MNDYSPFITEDCREEKPVWQAEEGEVLVQAAIKIYLHELLGNCSMLEQPTQPFNTASRLFLEQ